MKVNDVKRPYLPVAAPALVGNEKRYVLECIESSWISTHGQYVARFEQAFSDLVGAPYAVSCANGTAALHLCLSAFGIGPGDEVIVPAFTFVATANAVKFVRATPVFVDVEPGTWTLDLTDVERKIGPRTKAIIPVHIYGHPVDMDPLLALARARRIKVIEDAAQAHGARYKGRSVGSLGDAAAFSFFANKAITCGQGGMVVTADRQIAQRVGSLKNAAVHPEKQYWHEEIGFNYRMTNLEAAIGLAQIERFDWHLTRRREVAAHYRARLRNVPGIRLQEVAPRAEHGYWMVTILIEDDSGARRDRCAAFLAQRGIETRVSFHPVPYLPPYQAGDSNFPVSERISRTGLTLPTHAGMTSEDVDYVCDQLAQFMATFKT
jgi:perosamine synthetase